MNYEFFERLNRQVPGSVKIDRDNSTVTLIGWTLEEFNEPGQKQNSAKQIEETTSGFNCSHPESENSFPKHIFLVDGRFKRVINPLSYSDRDTSKCDEACCLSRVSGKQACASEKENEAAEGDKNLVPVVKSKLRKWILHVREFLFSPIGK